METVVVLGAGSWGTAFSTLLAENGYKVNLWCHEKEVCDAIVSTRINARYLPEITLDEKIRSTTSLEQALTDVHWVFEVVPVKFLRHVLKQASSYVKPSQTWVILSKGIEQDTLFLPSQILDDVFGYHEKKATVSGPNFAKDLTGKIPTATTVATSDCDLGRELQHVLANSYFRPYLSLDLIGVQVGGAIKNVLALFIGIAKGAGARDNTIAYLFTRGLGEMAEIADYFGGKRETIYGLSGLGDFFLTAMGMQGRNQRVGMMIGQGKSLEAIEKETEIIAEGVNTTQSLHQIIQKSNLRLPICQGAYRIVFEGLTFHDLLAELMVQPLTEECL